MTNREKAKKLYEGMSEIKTSCPNGTLLSSAVLCDYAGQMGFIRWIETQLNELEAESNDDSD